MCTGRVKLKRPFGTFSFLAEKFALMSFKNAAATALRIAVEQSATPRLSTSNGATPSTTFDVSRRNADRTIVVPCAFTLPTTISQVSGLALRTGRPALLTTTYSAMPAPSPVTDDGTFDPGPA